LTTANAAAALLPGSGVSTAYSGVTLLRSQSEQAGVTPVDDVALAAGGDVRAFERVYRTHLPRVHSLVRRMAG